VLAKEHIADLLEQLLGLRARAPFALQSGCKRLDAVEDAGDAGLRCPRTRLFDSTLAMIWSRSREAFSIERAPEGSI
jgi:hypothetical protein